jgi:hypothetical protein
MIEVINSFIHMMEFIKGEKPVFPVAWFILKSPLILEPFLTRLNKPNRYV